MEEMFISFDFSMSSLFQIVNIISYESQICFENTNTHISYFPIGLIKRNNFLQNICHGQIRWYFWISSNLSIANIFQNL